MADWNGVPLPPSMTPAQAQDILQQIRTYANSVGLPVRQALNMAADELVRVSTSGTDPDWVAVRARIKRRADAVANTPVLPPGYSWEYVSSLIGGVAVTQRRPVGSWVTVTDEDVV